MFVNVGVCCVSRRVKGAGWLASVPTQCTHPSKLHQPANKGDALEDGGLAAMEGVCQDPDHNQGHHRSCSRGQQRYRAACNQLEGAAQHHLCRLEQCTVALLQDQ